MAPYHPPEYHRSQTDDSDCRPFLSPLEYERWLRRLNGANAFGVFVSVCMTGEGLYMLIGSWPYALLLVVFSGISIYFSYSLLLHTFPRAGSYDRVKLGALGAGIVVLVVVPTSTTFGVAAFAAPESVKLSLGDISDEASARLSELQKLRAAEQAVVPALQAASAEFEALAKDEVENRRFSGTPSEKEGPISQDLRGIARGFESAANLVKSDEERLKTAAGEAETAVSQMHKIASEAKANADSMRTSSEAFKKELAKFDVAMADLARSSLDADLLAPVDAAIRQQAQSPLTGRAESIRAKQQAAKDTIATLAAQARAAAANQIAEARARPEPGTEAAPEPLEVPEPMDAVIKHFARVVHTAAYPIAIDIGLPLISLLALTLMRERVAGGVLPASQINMPYPMTRTRELPDDSSSADASAKAKIQAARQHLHQARNR